MKQKSLLRTMLLLFALIVGMSSAWADEGDEINRIANIQDGQSYYIKGVRSNNIYYLKFTDTVGSQSGTESSTKEGAQLIVFEKQSDGTYYLKTSSNHYIAPGTSNGKVQVSSTGIKVTVTDQTKNSTNYIRLSITSGSDTWSIQKNTGVANFGGYKNTQNDITLIEGPSTHTLESISLSGTYPTIFTEKDEFSHEGMTVTANYDDNSTKDVTSNATFSGYDMNTTGSQTVTVSYTEGEITMTATYGITVNAGTKYTVTFAPEGGSCSTASLTETEYMGGVTLPAATINNVAGWVFAGWATAAVSNPQTRPTLYLAGSTYYPTADITLHAVYSLADAANKYREATANSDIVDGVGVVISSLGSNKYTLANNNGTLAAISNFTPTDGVITCENTQAIWTLNIASGNVTISNGGKFLKRSNATVSAADDASNWTINKATYGTNRFLVKDASTNYYLEHNGTSWIAYNTSNVTSSNVNNYIGLTIYVPVSNAYNSNPTAVVTPTVAFASKDDKTLYLDGTTTYTNTATVDGVSKTITYSSSDTNVATVDANGVVTAVGIGEATITASVEAELGVSSAASDTYNVVVKTSTIAGTKALATSSTQVIFSADFTDAVITYVSGTHAYIQDGTAAIYASCATNDWTAGKKFSGAVTGKIKKSYGVYEITELTATPVSGGVIPEAIEIAITDITSDTYLTYEGKKVVLNNITVSTAMASTATSGGEVSDGTNTIKIGAPATGITLTKDERGNITGFVAQYNGTFRLNLYEQTQFAKTHNAPTDQDLEFASYDFSLDEDTDDYDNFAGQQVSGAQGTVSYAKTSDTDNIITSLNTETGVVVLSGAYGTATITATAAATEVTESGVTTPYNETTKSYTITVYPRYSVVFSINGVETTVRQATHGESIDVAADPEDIGAYKFQGWVENEVAAGSSEPDNYVNLSSTYTPTANKTFYAVFALESVLPDVEQTSTFTFGSSVTSPYTNGEITWTFSSVSGSGLQSQSLSFAPSNKVSSVKGIELSKNSNAWGKTVYVTLTDANNNQIFKVYCGSETNNFTNNKYSHDLTDNQSSSYTLASSGNAWLSSIIITYLAPGLNYSDYRTSITIPESVTATIASSGFTTYCSPYDLSFENVTGLTAAYVVSESTNAVATLKKVTAVPGGTGVILKGTAGAAVTIPVAEYTGSEISNILVGTLNATHVDIETVYVVSGGEFKLFAGTEIPAGKAYLPASAIGGVNAPSLSFDFGGETTSINSLTPAFSQEEGVYYDLSGRRVAQPTKGLYIVNGKKVLVP